MKPLICSPERRRILVVDDELGPRESLRMILKDQYEVILAESGREGLERVREGGVDLVILDLKMDRMDGITALEMIRKADSSVEVVILTGYGTLETAKKAIRLGACDYVSKPFDVGDIMRTVEKNLMRRQKRTEGESSLGRLKALNFDLEEEVKALRKLLSSEKLFSTFFHDICNPLAAALGFIQVIFMELEEKNQFEKKGHDDVQKYLRIVEKELERCRLMFRSFLNMVRNNKTTAKKLHLKVMIQETLTLVEPHLDRNGISVERRLEEDLMRKTLVPPELQQVILNLIVNAIHAMEGGGRLSVSARLDSEGSLVVEIADTGCGMKEEVLQKAFKPFFTTKASSVGTGLGLAISRGIVEKFGGKILLQSLEGAGTRVRIVLPSNALQSLA